MQTLYVDVYFLINFTVDILAIYFALMLSRVCSSSARLISSATFGAAVATVSVLVSDGAKDKLVFSILGLLMIAFTAPKNAGARRRIRFLVSFLIFSSLFGAAVSFLWDLLDKYTYITDEITSGGGVNRRLILFALIVLFSIGVFKMIISIFGDSISEGSVTLELVFLDNNVTVSALVDSGNLAVDPMDMRPVLLLKRSTAAKILPNGVLELHDPDLLTRDIRKRIRLIPISKDGKTHVLTGVRLDGVYVVSNDKREEVAVTVAVDKEGGSFGGYEALIPSAALCNVRKN